jgi:lipopolysaccharide export system permease protein
MTFEAESFSDVFKGTVIYVKEILKDDRFKGIFIYREEIKSLDEPVVIVAEDGVVHSNPEKGMIRLHMNNGTVHTYNSKSSSEMSFTEYDFILTSQTETDKKIKPEEIMTSDLWKGRKENRPWAIELNRRAALPFACIIFGLLGPALSSSVGRIGRLGGFSLSLTVLILYYMLIILGEGLAKSGEIPPAVGGWAPNIIFGGITAFFVHIAHRDRPLKKL